MLGTYAFSLVYTRDLIEGLIEFLTVPLGLVKGSVAQYL